MPLFAAVVAVVVALLADFNRYSSLMTFGHMLWGQANGFACYLLFCQRIGLAWLVLSLSKLSKVAKAKAPLAPYAA